MPNSFTSNHSEICGTLKDFQTDPLNFGQYDIGHNFGQYENLTMYIASYNT